LSSTILILIRQSTIDNRQFPGVAIPYANLTGARFRELCRLRDFDGPTAGVALGYTQVNLVILRAQAASEFEQFCHLNPKPCPLLEMTKPGQYEPATMARGADVRTDLPRYRVFRNGECVDRPTSIKIHWPDNAEDFVAFLIGCSFTFETALLKAGVPVRHIEENRNVPMFGTNVACRPAGRFTGPLVVSMRPMTPAQADRAVKITACFPRVHGAPVHIGDPGKLGIADIHRPDYGDSVSIRDGEVPVFWACGVTPMEAIIRARLDIAITHEPGHMLVTDVRDETLYEKPLQ
jgi:uncharacterized protein YcsI (UPF0317 family)